jgi:hypothetical protein
MKVSSLWKWKLNRQWSWISWFRVSYRIPEQGEIAKWTGHYWIWTRLILILTKIITFEFRNYQETRQKIYQRTLERLFYLLYRGTARLWGDFWIPRQTCAFRICLRNWRFRRVEWIPSLICGCCGFIVGSVGRWGF